MFFGPHTVEVVNYGPTGDGSDIPQTWAPYVQIDSLNIYSDVAASGVTVLPATPMFMSIAPWPYPQRWLPRMPTIMR